MQASGFPLPKWFMTYSCMDVEQTKDGTKEIYRYEYPSSIFKKHIIKFRTEYINSWDSKYAFNGEEKGLTGSRKFIEDIDGKYNSLININIDSVGYKDGRKVTFLDANTNTSLYEPMKTVIENNGLEVELDTDLKGTADSVVFDKVGIPAICIIDENVKEVIHTENDVPELIDYERLDKIVKSVYDFVSSYEFN